MQVTDDLLQNAVKTCFPKILKIAMKIGYYNGLINRFMAEEAYVRNVSEIIGMYSVMDCIKLEIFLSDMTNDQLMIIADGEESEIKALLWNAPDVSFADTLFNTIFEGK